MDDARLSPKERLISTLREQIESVEARLKETQTSMEQSQLEVDRMQQRAGSVSAALQRVEANFETVPRDDLRDAYKNELELRTRMANTRASLERLENTQLYLSELRDAYDELLNMFKAGALGDGDVAGNQVGDGGASGGYKMSLAGDQIVRIVEAQESERKRLANALHDGPAQSLTNFILQAEIVQRLFDRDPAAAANELNSLKSAASISFQKIRDFIFELRPMMLDDLGLIATMRRHTENYDEKSDDLSVQFHLTGAERRLPNHVEVMMFRGLQMLITNAIEQLGAKNVEIKLDVGDNRLMGTVNDNGRYFNAEVELDPAQGDSPLQNLLDLRERVEMVGGQLDIFSDEDGNHNSIEILLPFADDGEMRI